MGLNFDFSFSRVLNMVWYIYCFSTCGSNYLILYCDFVAEFVFVTCLHFTLFHGQLSMLSRTSKFRKSAHPQIYVLSSFIFMHMVESRCSSLTESKQTVPKRGGADTEIYFQHRIPFGFQEHMKYA